MLSWLRCVLVLALTRAEDAPAETVTKLPTRSAALEWYCIENKAVRRQTVPLPLFLSPAEFRPLPFFSCQDHLNDLPCVNHQYTLKMTQV